MRSRYINDHTHTNRQRTKQMPETIDRADGRRLFGSDPEAYDDARPDYPAWVFDTLESSGALFRGASTIEIGPGTGLATRVLTRRGARPMTLVEPDARFAGLLQTAVGQVQAHRLIQTTFEDADLPDDAYDLACAATSFHWVDPTAGLSKLRRVVRAGGTTALFWNVFQDDHTRDHFHEATEDLLKPLARSPSGAPNTLPYALDRAAREADARRAGFQRITYREGRWSFQLTPGGVRKLYQSFSGIQRLDERERTRILDELVHIATTTFGGTIVRHVTTCLYQLS